MPLNVNYHAFSTYCTHQSGLPLFPGHAPIGLNLGCLLFLAEPTTYKETLNAYLRFVNDYGPDDYFKIRKLIEPHFANLDFSGVMSVLRLSGYDAVLFWYLRARLIELLPDITAAQQDDLFWAIGRIWDTYYPLGGEAIDVATVLGDVLMFLGFTQEALFYFEMAGLIYGQTVSTLYRLAVCHCTLGQLVAAAPIIETLQTLAPEDEVVQALSQQFAQELALTERTTAGGPALPGPRG